MFSLNLMHYIVDPDNSTEKNDLGRDSSEENYLLKVNTSDSSKIKNDYDFLFKFLSTIEKTFKKLCS